MASVFDKYGVPTADGTIEAPVQPKLQYRFKIAFTNFGGLSDSFSLTKNVINTTIPNFSQEEVPIDSYVSKYYVIGKHTWAELSVTLRNDASNTVVGIIQQQLDNQHNAFTQSHAPSAGAVKFNAKILYLDGSNGEDVDILEGWHVTGCWLSNVEWGSLDYTTSEPSQITLTIRPDSAFHIVDSSSLGDEESVNFSNSSASSEGDFEASTDDNFSAT